MLSVYPVHVSRAVADTPFTCTQGLNGHFHFKISRYAIHLLGGSYYSDLFVACIFTV